MEKTTLILDYETFQVFKQENKYYYHSFEDESIKEVILLAKEPIEPFSTSDSDDYLLSKYPEADVTGEACDEIMYYWFVLKEGEK